jgi:putative transposase
VVVLDFFVVPTVTHKLLFVLVILAHERRRIVNFSATEYPTVQWAGGEAPRYLLCDRDRIYGASFRQRVRNMDIEEVLIAPRSPWQNPYVERVIGSLRRELLAHVIVLNQQHLRRLLTAYAAYYHRIRTHLSLAMGCPEPRPISPPDRGRVVAVPEVGELHHHYERQAA